jgi:hypothetical protein
MNRSADQSPVRSSLRIARIGYPLGLALGVTVITFAFGVCSFLAFERNAPFESWLAIWNRWDAPHFLTVAEHGYGYALQGHEHLIALLPLYPTAIWLTHLLVSNWHAAGVLVSNLCCAGAFVYLFLLTRLEEDESTAQRAVLLFAVFPTAFILHAAYSESIFMLVSIGAFYHARRSAWCTACILGMLATGARVPGIALLPPLAVEYLQQRQFRWREIRWNVMWLALVPLGALVYLGINYHYYNDPLHFVAAQKQVWGAFFRWPWQGVSSNWYGLLHGTATERVIQYGGPFVAFVIATTALIAAPFFLRPAYTLYLALSWVMIFFNNFPVSSPRYLLGVFPLFMLGARVCRIPWLRDSLVFLSVLFYALCTMHFVRGWWAF